MPGRKKKPSVKPMIEFLSIGDICKLAGFSRPTFKRMEKDFPEPVMFGNTRMWRKEAVVKFLLKLGL